MKSSIAWLFAFSASVSLSSALTGCGDDTSSTGGAGSGGTGGATTGTAGTGGGAGKGGSAGTGGSSGSGGGGTGGTGGAAGTGGGKADAGTADTGGPPTVVCGTKTCEGFDLGGMALAPCCPPGEMNACGLSIGGVICFTSTPGTPDPTCPDVTIPMAPTPAPGCCTATGVCGADIGAPLGCNDVSILTGGGATPCGGDASTPPRDSGSDAPQPPADSGPGGDAGPSDSGSSDGTGGDSGGSDTGPGDGPPADGGRGDSTRDGSGLG
jgi:hypothetical protein